MLRVVDYSFRNLDDRTLEDNTTDEEDESYSSDGSDSAVETGPALQVCTLLGYQSHHRPHAWVVLNVYAKL